MLGEGLRLIRVFHDCKSTHLAKELDISAGYISEIESGKKIPSLSILNKYAMFFETSVSSIMFFSENINENKESSIKSYSRNKILKFLQFIENESKK